MIMWNGANKTWIVDLDKVHKLIETGCVTVSSETPAPKATRTTVNGWCNKCHSYCYGDCEA